MLQKYRIISETTQDTFLLGQKLSALLFPSLMLSLSGELGAGKTVIARGIVQGLGGKHVRSPSFTLVNEYPTTPPVAHVDLYRLADSETDTLGLEEYLENGYILIVEWADRLHDTPGSEVLNIHISYKNLSNLSDVECAADPNDMERQITLTATGTRTSEILESLKNNGPKK